LRRVSAFLIIFFLSCAKEVAPVKLIRGPYLRHLSSSSSLIVFQVESGKEAEILYGTSPSELSKRKSGEIKRIRYGDIEVSTASVRLENLKPDTEYFYRVKATNSDRVWSFKTYPEDITSFTFVVFGDNRTYLEVFKKMVSLISNENPLFVIHTGDCVDTGTLYSGMNLFVGWEEFVDTMIPLMERSPVYISFGNHEAGGEDFFTSYFPAISSDFSPFYYSFSTGDLHFFVLNSEGDLSPSGEQLLWLENSLSDIQGGYLIGVIHRPPYSSSEHGKSAEEGKEEEILMIRENFVPIFERYGFKVVFSGHEHNYERTNPINGVVYVITGGGGGAPLYDRKLENSWTAVFEKTYNYVVVHSSPSSLEFIAKDKDGKIIDRFEIKKE
jgi:predicted phosphodiesterase